MTREKLTIQEFEAVVKKQGYCPVYAFVNDLQTEINVDMIIHFRVHDGKVKFVTVPFASDDEFSQIRSIIVVGILELFGNIGRIVPELRSRS